MDTRLKRPSDRFSKMDNCYRAADLITGTKIMTALSYYHYTPTNEQEGCEPNKLSMCHFSQGNNML